MKVYGALEAAQIEWFTNAGKPAASSYPFRVIYVTDLKQIQVSDGTNWNPSALYTYTAGTLPAAGASNQYQVAFITDTLQVKVSNGTEWKTIGARLDTYTSGTIPAAASNSNSIIWVSDLQQVQVSNGTAWVQVGSKAGTKNYFSQNNANSDFETNSVSPWSACTLTFSSGVPSGAPTLTATQMAIATTATNPLSGTYSMQLTKSAANAQYQGYISGSLTIDREDTAKVLYGSFYYEVVSGTIDMSGSSTQDLEIWIYNTVSGQWTQPAGYRGMNQSSGVGKVVFSFQTDGTYANNAYKIAVITQQTGTSAYVVKFDDFQVGPQAIVLGSAMTDWQSYTPTVSGFTTSAMSAFWRRVGDSIEIIAKFTKATHSASEMRFGLPPGLTSADTSKIPAIRIAGDNVISNANTPATSPYIYNVLIEPSVTYLTFGMQGTANQGLVKQNANNYFGATDILTFQAKVPIAGWGSYSQMSSDTDTRIIAAQYRGNAGTSVTANVTNIPFTTKINDSSGSWGGSSFTAPVTGYYSVSGSVEFTTSNNSDISLYKDGTVTATIITNYNTAATVRVFNGFTYLNAGQVLSVRSNITLTLTNNPNTHYINIYRLSGPSVVTATESVNARYFTTAGQTIGTTDTIINFDNKSIDSHSSVTTGASWKFVAPVSGTYLASGFITLSSTSARYVYLYINGVLNSQISIGTGSAWEMPFSSTLVNLNAGDYLDFRAKVSPSATLTTTANSNYMNIIRVGN